MKTKITKIQSHAKQILRNITKTIEFMIRDTIMITRAFPTQKLHEVSAAPGMTGYLLENFDYAAHTLMHAFIDNIYVQTSANLFITFLRIHFGTC